MLVLTGPKNRRTIAAVHSEAVGSWGALVTPPPNDVSFTAALTSDLIALAADGTLRVALTGCMQQTINAFMLCFGSASAQSMSAVRLVCLLTQGPIVNVG